MKLPEPPPPPRRGLLSSLRASFFTGLVVIAPIGITIWLVWSLIGWIDGWVLPLVPDRLEPVELIQRYTGVEVNIRGLGVATILLFTILVGWVAKGIIGRSLIAWAEGVVLQIPGVRILYSGLKQIVETVVNQGDQNFEKACLIEYPRKGIWAIGFISTSAKGEIADKSSQDMVSVFVPTTPNPTSGFLLFFPTSDVQILRYERRRRCEADHLSRAGLSRWPGQRDDRPATTPRTPRNNATGPRGGPNSFKEFGSEFLSQLCPLDARVSIPAEPAADGPGHALISQRDTQCFASSSTTSQVTLVRGALWAMR